MENEAKSRYLRILKAIRDMQLKTSHDSGYIAERSVGIKQSKPRIPSHTGTAKYRIPDKLIDDALLEVKNVKRLRLTSQLKDFLHYCDETHRCFTIITREDVVLSKELEILKRDERINFMPLGFLFSEEGKRRVLSALEPNLSRITSAILFGKTEMLTTQEKEHAERMVIQMAKQASSNNGMSNKAIRKTASIG